MQAAYTSLLALVPAKQPVLDAQLARSLAQISGERGPDLSITLGREWGEKVAQQILAWRTQDGTSKTPTYEGSTAAGYWRHAPNANAVPAGASIPVPFVLSNLSAFDPGPPYGIADRAAAMATAAYAADVNETKARGGAVSTARTSAQTDMAVFIDISDVSDVNAAVRRSIPASTSLVENARTFALVNIAAWDAGIVLPLTKYKYGLWRPDQAIQFADKDGNSATTADPTWRPLRCTPSHPEYLSAHVLLYTVMTATAAALLGKDTPVTFTTSNPNAPTVRAFTRFSEISDATVEGRVNVGFHFRSCCILSQKVGYTIADALVATGLRPTKASERTTVSVRSPSPSVGAP
jgi:hypothetical protein